MRVHAGNHHVHLLQHRIGKIQLASGQDVHLDAGKDGDAFRFLCDAANGLDVLERALVIEAVGESQVLGVVGDGHVFVAASARRRNHLFDSTFAVSGQGVHVHVALNVGLRDQLRQRSRRRGFQLAQVLAQLRRNELQTQLLVDLLLGLAGHAFFICHARQPVLTQGVAHLERPLAQRDAVVFGAGEVLQRRSEGIWRKQAHIDLKSAAQLEADLVLAFGQDILDAGEFQDRIHHFVALRFVELAGDQHVEIAHRLAAAPQRTGGGNLVHAGQLLEQLDQLARRVIGNVDQKASGDLAVAFNRLQNFLLALFAQPGQLAQLAFPRQPGHALDVTYLESVPDQGDGLGPHPLDFE